MDTNNDNQSSRNSILIGNNDNQSSRNSILIGNNGNQSSSNSILIGNNNNQIGNNSNLIGNNNSNNTTGSTMATKEYLKNIPYVSADAIESEWNVTYRVIGSILSKNQSKAVPFYDKTC